MILLVQELSTELKQSILVKSQNLAMQSVQVHLYRHLLPTGSLNLELRDSRGKLIKASNTVAISSIPHTKNYFHGWIKFDLAFDLRKNTQYVFALKASGGYTFDESAYIGWVNDFDLGTGNASYAHATGVSAPAGLRIWANEIFNRGAL